MGSSTLGVGWQASGETPDFVDAVVRTSSVKIGLGLLVQETWAATQWVLADLQAPGETPDIEDDVRPDRSTEDKILDIFN